MHPQNYSLVPVNTFTCSFAHPFTAVNSSRTALCQPGFSFGAILAMEVARRGLRTLVRLVDDGLQRLWAQSNLKVFEAKKCGEETSAVEKSVAGTSHAS